MQLYLHACMHTVRLIDNWKNEILFDEASRKMISPRGVWLSSTRNIWSVALVGITILNEVFIFIDFSHKTSLFFLELDDQSYCFWINFYRTHSSRLISWLNFVFSSINKKSVVFHIYQVSPGLIISFGEYSSRHHSFFSWLVIKLYWYTSETSTIRTQFCLKTKLFFFLFQVNCIA